MKSMGGTGMEVERYLQRISWTGPIEVNRKTLFQLQEHHMLHIPFENLDVIQKVRIPLDVETYFRKVVLNHRGGFCYELNGLFNWLLQSLGFNSRLASATVKRPDGGWTLSGSHACLIVDMEKPYLVDVGFGDSVRMPLPLSGEEREDVSGTYRLAKLKDGVFDLQKYQKPDGWETLYRLDTSPRTLNDFEEVCQFNQTSPRSPFTKQPLVSLATPDGRLTLSGNTLTTTHRGEKHQTVIDNKDMTIALKQYFGIDLNGCVSHH
jgi:N-hydroxyarylamine O-acetyltransferase